MTARPGRENFIPPLSLGGAVDTSDLLRVGLDFERTWVVTGAEATRPSYGAIVRTPRYPLIHLANLAWVERLPSGGVEEILADLDAAFDGTEVRHRNVVFEDAQEAFGQQEALAARGFQPLADLAMAQLGLPACIANPDLGLREVGAGAPEDDYRRLRLRLFEGVGYGTEEARQLYAIARERGAALGQRDFVGYHQGAPAGTISLWTRRGFGFINDVVTMPEFRNRGVARTMLFLATKRALAAQCQYTLLFTDLFDSPQAMYRTLGYFPIGEIRTFLKAEPPAGV